MIYYICIINRSEYLLFPRQRNIHKDQQRRNFNQRANCAAKASSECIPKVAITTASSKLFPVAVNACDISIFRIFHTMSSGNDTRGILYLSFFNMVCLFRFVFGYVVSKKEHDCLEVVLMVVAIYHRGKPHHKDQFYFEWWQHLKQTIRKSDLRKRQLQILLKPFVCSILYNK